MFQMEPLYKFLLEIITAVALTLVVLYSAGDGISMAKPPHPTISELGTVLNNQQLREQRCPQLSLKPAVVGFEPAFCLAHNLYGTDSPGAEV